MIQFIEHPHTGYALRTLDNAKFSDITIAFADDFGTASEKLTMKCAYSAGKEYIKVPLDKLRVNAFDLRRVQHAIDWGDFRKINIAGNGIYTLKDRIQPEIDDYIYNFFWSLLPKIAEFSEFMISSGGQTGVDEAGLKFGDKAGCKTICRYPKGGLYRNAFGEDITDKIKFLKRFGDEYDYSEML